jgi:hypothetical protein
MAVYSDDPEAPGPFVADSGSMAFNIYSDTPDPA